MSETTPSSGPSAAAHDLLHLLVTFAVGVQRFAMYPSGHPALEDIALHLMQDLTEALSHRDTLSIGVAYRQLVVEGATTDARHPLVSDLARRLHDHQIGAISFRRGITLEEVEELLNAVGTEPGHPHTPSDAPEEEGTKSWPHAQLHRVGYDRLRIRDDEGERQAPDRGHQLWLGLAQVSLASDEPLEEVPDADSVARNIRENRGESAYDQAVVGYLVQLADELKAGADSGPSPLRGRVSRLIGELDEATLARLLEFGGDAERRKRFVMDANRSLTADSVVKVLQAAAGTSGQTISHSMIRLLTKLATHAGEGLGTVEGEADSACRAHIDALMADWSLDDPNPDTYTLSLDAMASAAPLFSPDDEEEGALAGAERIVSMGIEVEAWGPMVDRAVEDMVAPKGTARLVALLQEAPPGNSVAERAWLHVANLETLGQLLRAPGVENATVAELATRLGEPAVEELLDVLADASDLALRRRAFDVLSALDAARVAGPATQRLRDPRWFVQRNMLALLRRLGTRLGYLDLTEWATHEHPRVRQEALTLMLHQPDWVELAIPMALQENDEPVVRLALERIGPDTPESVLPLVVDRVLLDRSLSEDLRRVAARTLGWFASTEAADALIEVVTAGTTLLGTPRMAPTSPVMLEALWILATVWRHDGVAGRVLDAAKRARDPAVAAVLAEAERQDIPAPTERSR